MIKGKDLAVAAFYCATLRASTQSRLAAKLSEVKGISASFISLALDTLLAKGPESNRRPV